MNRQFCALTIALLMVVVLVSGCSSNNSGSILPSQSDLDGLGYHGITSVDAGFSKVESKTVDYKGSVFVFGSAQKEIVIDVYKFSTDSEALSNYNQLVGAMPNYYKPSETIEMQGPAVGDQHAYFQTPLKTGTYEIYSGFVRKGSVLVYILSDNRTTSDIAKIANLIGSRLP
jgi:hypothetical protein